MAAGLLGAFVVAVYFLAIDLAGGHPFGTPNALGSALFLGVPFDRLQPLRPIVIAGYTLVHGALFLGLSLVISALVLGSRRHPPSVSMLWIILAGSFTAGLTLLFGSFSLISAPLATGLRTPAMLGANLLAGERDGVVARRGVPDALAAGVAADSARRSRIETRAAPLPRERRRSAGPEERQSRLDPEWLHLFSLEQFARKLRAEPEYAENGRSGLVLIKTEQLRVVLEVASEGSKFAEHTVLGSATVVVLEGALEITCGDETRVVRAGEMVVIPHDRPRAMSATGDVCFLWTLSLEPPDAESDARSFAPVGPPRAFGPRGS
jgi:quercetin dioxygenase-like cupin family protein